MPGSRGQENRSPNEDNQLKTSENHLFPAYPLFEVDARDSQVLPWAA